MSRSGRSGSTEFTWTVRGVLLLAGAVLLALMATAAWLPPDARGFGTHQGLGLPPCSFRQLTGLRCPSCGMTTSWSHLVRGEFARAWRANAGGVWCGILAMVAAPWALGSAILGRPLTALPGPWAMQAVFCSGLALTLVDWLVRLAADRSPG